jgi:hypothetical protein
MPKIQSDYSQTVIYKLCCKDVTINQIYVGHTTNINNRKHNHKSNCCNSNLQNYNLFVYKFIRENGGWDNWSMIQIEEYDCNNKREAEMRERQWIETLNAKLNCNNPISSKEEKDKQKQEWYEENKNIILEKKKEHYEENKEQILEKVKQYAEKNKEQISEYQKEYQEKNKETISEQKKEYRENHKQESQKAHKEWREENKEKLKEQKSKVIDCECGKQFTFGNKDRHLKTSIHINYQNQLCGIIEESKITISDEEKSAIIAQKQKEYREKNAEKIKEYKKKYNDSHKEKNSEQRKKYYEEHKNEIIEQGKIYIEANKEKIKECNKKWYQQNKEKNLSKQKELFSCEYALANKTSDDAFDFGEDF